MRRVLFGLAAALLPMLCGCLGGTSMTDVDPVPPNTFLQGQRVLGIITAENRGVFLFNRIPVWSGNPYKPNFRSFKMFVNRLKPGYMDEMLAAEGRRLHASRLQIKSCTESSSGWFSLWILWRRQMRSEAIALGEKGTPDDKR